jgi:hypothetical protein
MTHGSALTLCLHPEFVQQRPHPLFDLITYRSNRFQTLAGGVGKYPLFIRARAGPGRCRYNPW